MAGRHFFLDVPYVLYSEDGKAVSDDSESKAKKINADKMLNV